MAHPHVLSDFTAYSPNAMNLTFGFELEFGTELELPGRWRSMTPGEFSCWRQRDPEAFRQWRRGAVMNLLHKIRVTLETLQVGASRSDAQLHARVVGPQQAHLTGEPLGQLVDGIYTGYKDVITISEEESHMWYQNATEEARRGPLKPNVREGFTPVTIEIASRVYRLDEFETAEREIETICQTIRENFNVFVNRGKAPRRCGTHIHWGCGREWTDEEVKKLLSFTWSFEDQLMDLHASWRRDSAMANYVALLRHHTTLAKQIRRGQAGIDFNALQPRQRQILSDQAMRTIWAAQSKRELVALSSPNKVRGAIGLQEILPVGSDLKVRNSQLNTIEFRHMQGSLDPENISAWIAVTAAIMTWCSLPLPRFNSRLRELVSKQDKNSEYSVSNLLVDLGVNARARNYFSSERRIILDQEGDPSKTIPYLPPALVQPVLRELVLIDVGKSLERDEKSRGTGTPSKRGGADRRRREALVVRGYPGSYCE